MFLPKMKKEINFPPKKVVVINNHSNQESNQNNTSDLDNEKMLLQDLKAEQPKHLMKRG